MTLSSLAPILQEHEFFAGLSPEYVQLLTECASNIRFDAGDMLFRQGEPADRFYLLRQGKVAIEISAPGRPTLTIKTLGDNDVLGWSWLFPPYQWQFDARALELTRAVALDGRCLRGKCDNDPVLGYELMKRFSQIMLDSLNATRLQLLDLYGLPDRRSAW
ncbi:cyclic nucleotide-binding domain-containing protein [Alkalinema sp. FACHB-956]|uniref:cyclic nucleotide-binding domain-containing protein n=1 Tax=Alkalinema sp. FACHB-956 TaxID=2692768 RepID=UPI0016888C30|nr:cyclic nucleotide-binding domain-containing protein [Alkalinema sp. FACHB-956]MBD2327975.1 cyclic nucleotide-binding domain-containing protein [Alkalinema sp. FACHB-956]